MKVSPVFRDRWAKLGVAGSGGLRARQGARRIQGGGRELGQVGGAEADGGPRQPRFGQLRGAGVDPKGPQPSDRFCQLRWFGPQKPQAVGASGCLNRTPPAGEGSSAKFSKRAAGDQMALEVEVVVDVGMDG